MGISTDGLLIFGFDLGEEFPKGIYGSEEEYEDCEDHNLEDVIADKAGLKYREDFTDEEAKVYFAKKRDLEATCPISIEYHCSYECPMYIIAIRGAKFSAHRGYPLELDQSLLTVSPEKIAAAKAWCESNGIEWQEPKWLLASLWG